MAIVWGALLRWRVRSWVRRLAVPGGGLGHKKMIRLISQGSRFEAEIGYSRAVVADGWVFVAGTTGYDYATGRIEPGVVAQCRQTLANIAWALEQAGASLNDVVRARYYLLDAADFPPCFPLLRASFAVARPAATMLVVAGLADPAMRIEIEVTARLQTEAVAAITGLL
jgi:enamine deaminase RidA (YjgF/YER057c/UK114 family)